MASRIKASWPYRGDVSWLFTGITEKFIALSIQHKARKNVESQRRAMFVHRRFYSALVLDDLVNEVGQPFCFSY